MMNKINRKELAKIYTKFKTALIIAFFVVFFIILLVVGHFIN